MILIGHDKVPYKPLYKCSSIEDISKTPSSSMVLLSSTSLVEHCVKNNILFALKVDNIEDLIVYSALNSTYLLVKDKEFVKIAQSIAQDYLLDSKILFVSDDYKDIEEMTKNSIDGIIFKSNAIHSV